MIGLEAKFLNDSEVPAHSVQSVNVQTCKSTHPN